MNICQSMNTHSNWIECSRNQESEKNNQFHSSTFNGVLCLDCVNVCKCDSQFEWKIVLIEFDYIRMAKFRRLIPLHSVTYRCLTLKAFKWMFAVLICVCVCALVWGGSEWVSERASVRVFFLGVNIYNSIHMFHACLICSRTNAIPLHPRFIPIQTGYKIIFYWINIQFTWKRL